MSRDDQQLNDLTEAVWSFLGQTAAGLERLEHRLNRLESVAAPGLVDELDDTVLEVRKGIAELDEQLSQPLESWSIRATTLTATGKSALEVAEALLDGIAALGIDATWLTLSTSYEDGAKWSGIATVDEGV